MTKNQNMIELEYKKYLESQIQFIVFVKRSPQLFLEISHAIVDLFETLERVDDDLFTSNQREILKNVRSQFKTYLIKNV